MGEFVNCGKPVENGLVWLTKEKAKEAATEAVKSYYQFTGDKLKKYVKENVDPAWEHFDVLKEGKIDVEQGPQFLRYVLNSQEFSFGI